MVRSEFEVFLKNLYDYFDRKQAPKVSQIGLWFSRVEKIVSEAMERIYQDLCQEDGLPKNLPKAMWGSYAEWQRDHPGESGPCECHNGIWEVCFYLEEPKQWAIYLIPCGRCSNTAWPRTRLDLLEHHLYRDREPKRFQNEPPEWGFIIPDIPSLKVFQDRISAYLATKTPKFDYEPSMRDISDPNSIGMPF